MDAVIDDPPDWEANTVQIREWLKGGAVSTPSLLRELRLWLNHFSDYEP